jgi:hemerythrin-like domain-containing protein
MRCTELLDKDHQIILRALDVLEQMADEVKKGHSVKPEDVESIVRFLKEFEDEHHQTKEESALFPVLLKNAGPQQSRLGQILFEHDQERSLVDGLEEALKTQHGKDFVHFAERLITLLRAHIYKEEFGLFGFIERTLSNEEDSRVVVEFARFDEALERGSGNELLNRLQILEDKYLRRRSA